MAKFGRFHRIETQERVQRCELRRRRLGHFIITHYTQQCPASLDGEGLEQQETNCTKM